MWSNSVRTAGLTLGPQPKKAKIRPLWGAGGPPHFLIFSTGCTSKKHSFVKSINAIGLKISALSIDIIKSYHAKNLACDCFRACFIELGIRNVFSRI